MALYKPYWLRRALTYLNWDIFTWHVYIGDTIEDAFDWVIDWLNYAIKRATDAWNKAVAAWDKAVEVGKNAWSDLCKETAKIWNNIETWWSDLNDWWKTKVTWIRDLVDTAEDWLKERIDDVQKGLNKLGVWWDNFTTEILPGLASRFDITKAFDDFMLTWRDLFEGWEAFKDKIFAFFTDPLDWLWQQFTDWFLGKEK